MNIDLGSHREQFLAFVAPFAAGAENGPLRLKVEHSFRVLEHVQVLVEDDGAQSLAACEPELARAALLAGLYHDCGRFPQFRHYRTFMDGESEDHARLGVAAIREQGFLRLEPERVRKLAEAAVELHNRYALPDDIGPDLRLITDMVRDADKLDILRVMAEHLESALPEKDAVLLSVRDDPERWTPKILDDVMSGRVARYVELRYVNDFRLLLGTWVHELKFPATRASLRRNGLLDVVLEGLPKAPEMERAAAYLRELLA